MTSTRRTFPAQAMEFSPGLSTGKPCAASIFTKRKRLIVSDTLVSKLSTLFGAGGGGRTRTVLPPRDFESRTSASSITPACYLNSITDWFGFFNCFFRPGQNFFFPFSVFPQKNGCFLSHCVLYYTTSIIGLAVPQKRYARPAGRKDGAYEKSLCHHRTGAGHFRHGGRRDCGGFQLSGHETAPCSVI